MKLLAQARGTSPVVWQLEADWPWSPWFTLLFVAAAGLGVVYLYLRESSPAGVAYRAMLAVLRLTTIALVLVMLSGLLFSATRSGSPRLVVLLDHSASMGLEQPDDPTLDASETGSPRSRFEAARELFIADKAALIAKWQNEYKLEIVAVANGSTALTGQEPGQLAAELLRHRSRWARVCVHAAGRCRGGGSRPAPRCHACRRSAGHRWSHHRRAVAGRSPGVGKEAGRAGLHHRVRVDVCATRPAAGEPACRT